MYADRVEAGANRSIRERLNGNSFVDSGRTRKLTGKRQRQDEDKWEHDLYEYEGPRQNRRVGVKDLRQELQRKSILRSNQSVKGSLSGGTRDLREKLSGTMYSQHVEAEQPKLKLLPESSKPDRKTIVIEAPLLKTRKAVSSTSNKKAQPKVKAESVDGFLQSVGLEKYSITFQAEEVDMTTLVHMTDEDLKALGIPMGPRKKILLALESKG